MPRKPKPSTTSKASSAESKLAARTVVDLRAMAKKVLGAGSSKLRTKADLVSALLAPRPQKSAARRAGKRLPAVAKKPVSPSPVGSKKPERTAPEHLAQQSRGPPLYDERLGELPERYWDDSFVALPIGPEALFFYWDFKPDTETAARAGLRRPRAVLTLYSGGHAVEHIDFALESRSYYVRSLSPGKTYEAEIFFVGENGERRRLGAASNAVTLPPRGLSPIVDDRFIRFPWGAPLGTTEHPYVATPGRTVHAARRGPLGSSPSGHGRRATPPTPVR
jgi:hypothetical protein